MKIDIRPDLTFNKFSIERITSDLYEQFGSSSYCGDSGSYAYIRLVEEIHKTVGDAQFFCGSNIEKYIGSL